MNEQANTIQIVINTLQDLDIKSTFNNMNRLMGAIQTLAKLRDELNQKKEETVLEFFGENGEKIGEERFDGDADTE